jgi:hypothetical protein
MNQTHDDDETETGEWVYHKSDGEERKKISEEQPATGQINKRVAASRYVPIIEYDRENKSISFTTRL